MFTTHNFSDDDSGGGDYGGGGGSAATTSEMAVIGLEFYSVLFKVNES